MKNEQQRSGEGASAGPENYPGASRRGVIENGRGVAIALRTGKLFYIFDPRPEDIDIVDIAHALSNVPHFGGHTREFYSVAQHSIHVSHLVAPEGAMWGLLHDAAEAYIGDISRPLKHHLDAVTGGFIKATENTILGAIAEKFGLPRSFPPDLKHADDVALSTEKRDLMAGFDWPDMPEAVGDRLFPFPPVRAKAEFLQRFADLGGDYRAR